MAGVWGPIKKLVLVLAIAGTPTGVRADRVELVNGDTLTGEVTAQTDQGVTLTHPALGEVLIPAGQVKQVHLDAPPEPEDLVPAAQPQPEAKPEPEPQPEPDPARVQEKAQEAAEVAAEPSFLDKFLDEWKSQITIGLNGATGNTDRQNYYAKFATRFEDGRDRWTINSQWFYGVADGTKTQNQFNADFTKDWLQKDSPWFFFVKGQYKYDQKRAWENRTSGFGGGGYTLAKTDDVEVNTRLGFGGTYEYGSVNEFTPEALFGGSVVKWKVSDRAAFSGEAIYYPSLEDSSVFRIESKLEWTYKMDLAKGLSLKLGVQNEYDSRTPNDNSNNDLKYYGAMVLGF